MRFVLITILISAALLAQSPTAAIVGLVTDQSDSAIPGAQVTGRNLQTNYVQTFTTGAEGLYRFPALPLGTYEVSVTAKGFERFVQSNVVIRGAEVVRVD
ncbi:MAG TPA: carboxypeptidase-like regulatory domain-containing protein, partial [Bryobacterales bacterium]|nr:carboxypeptidase-like regulatory domain-containing protein [Bryobacterales bacterium]